jgi:methyl-accepting chemotaxis protein
VKIFKLTIGKKLYAGFLVVIALILVLAVYSYTDIQKVDQSSQAVYDRSNENYLWQRIESLTATQSANYLSYITSQDKNAIDKAKVQKDDIAAAVAELRTIVPERRLSKLDAIEALAGQVSELGESTIISLANQDLDAYVLSKPNWEAKRVELAYLVADAVDSSKKDVQTLLSDSRKTADASIFWMAIICGAAVLFALAIAFFISRSISGGINKVQKAMRKMAAGDLTEKVRVHTKDEVEDMAKSYSVMRNQWISLISQLKESSVQLTQASDQLAVAAKQSSESTQQVATSAQQMARGAQEQSTNAQETAKSIEQLSGVISQLSEGAQQQTTSVQSAIYSITEVSETMTVVAQNAAKAAQGAKQAAESAVTGAEKSKQTLSGMEKIKTTSLDVAKKIEELGARSAEIGKIVAVIDDIAAQTNLLALNAAIEAARAGEQGRGFAVVSDEVRKLAERSAAATKEIADLIGSIQKGVKEATQVTLAGSNAVTEGFKMAKEAGQSLEQIMQAASAVNDQVDLIAQKAQQVNTSTNALVKTIDAVGAITETNSTATEQMTASASQVSKSIETVAGIAEENSAATEEVSASAEEMSAQVQEIVASSQTLKEMAISLEKSVSAFKLEETAVQKAEPKAGAAKSGSPTTATATKTAEKAAAPKA